MNARFDIPKLDRAKACFDLKQDHLFDLLVIGGGATGLGIALDASLRGLSVALVEQHDFQRELHLAPPNLFMAVSVI